jgi:hypothetical protein
MHMADQFSPHMEFVARHFWSDPNATLSSKNELRWGSHGSKCVDLDKGVWFDNEAAQGGGVLGLVEREAGLKGAEAVEYLRDLGVLIEDRREAALPKPAKRIVATYDYTDENGDLLFQVVRYEPKDFRQRQPDKESGDGWSWRVKGVRQVPYRLPEVIEAIATGKTVFIVEGEKDADKLWRLGIPATCNAGGAGKWPEAAQPTFAGARVVLLPDNDDAGRNHAAVVGAALKDTAADVRVLELSGLPPKGDVSDWLRDGGTAQALQDLAASARPWTPAAPASQFGAVLWRDISAAAPRTDYLIDDLCFPGDLGLIIGESRAAKTFGALDLALAIARGQPFFDMKTRRGLVLYQAGEGASGVISRLQAYGIHHELTTEHLPFVLLKRQIDLYSPEGDVDAFIAEAKAWQAWFGMPVSKIIVDTFSAATTGADENASKDVSRIISNGKKIKEATGASFSFVHHKNAAGVKARGHTSLFADSDYVLDFMHEEDEAGKTTGRHMTFRKVKDGPTGRRIDFKLQPVTIGSRDDGKPITSCVVAPAQDGDPQAGKNNRAQLTTGHLLVLRALKDALDKHGGYLPPTIEAPDYTRGVDWKVFYGAYRGLCDPDRTDDAIRQAVKRDGDYLLTRGLIGRSSPWVWITRKGNDWR